MKNLFLIVIATFLLNNNLFAQRYAVADGNWNSDIWSTTPGGSVIGGLRPSSSQDAYTNGHFITIAATANCANLLVTFNLANSLTINSGTQLNIFGTLTGYNDATTLVQAPTAQIITFASNSSRISFRGSAIGTYSPFVINNWSQSCILQRTVFQLGSSTTANISGSLSVQNDLFRIFTGNIILDGIFEGNSTTNLTIESGATLTCNAAIQNVSKLTVLGNIINNSSIDVTSAEFAGSTPINISGSGVISVGGLLVSNTAGVSNNSNIELNGILDLGASGVFDADGSGSGSFTLLSTGLTTGGYIAALTTPSNFTGDITVQRFVDGPAEWRYFSVPITDANVGMWQATMPVTGGFSNASSGGTVGCSSCASIYTYNAVTEQYDSLNPGPVSTTSVGLSHTTGYSAYTYNVGDFTLSVSGNPVKDNVTIPLSSNGAGYNLIPNPYPSPIDWDNVTTTGTSNTVYMTTSQGAFGTYLKGSGSCTGCSFNPSWRGEIAIGQSFWIESSSAPSIILTEAAKVSNATFAKMAPKPINSYIRVELQSVAQNQKDDILINFETNSTFGLEFDYDAKKLRNSNHINLSCYNNDPTIDYVINSIPLINNFLGNSTVKLRINNTPQGMYNLNFKELEDFSLNYDIYLIDNFKNKRIKINKGSKFGSIPSYSFNVNQNAQSMGDNRFEVEFKKLAVKSEKAFGSDFKVYPNPTNSDVNVLIDQESIDFVEKMTLSDFNGKIYLEINKKDLNIENDFNISHLKNGIYVLKILGQENEKNFKIYKQ